MTDTVMTKKTQDGRTVEFRVEGFSGYYTIEAYIAGQLVSQGTEVVRLAQPVKGCTHRLDKVALTTDEATTLQQAVEATPAYVEYKLRQERQDLIAQHSGLCEDAQETYWRLHNQERADAWSCKAEIDKQADEAWQAVVAFDAAHPEIVAKIRAEKAETAERFANNN